MDSFDHPLALLVATPSGALLYERWVGPAPPSLGGTAAVLLLRPIPTSEEHATVTGGVCVACKAVGEVVLYAVSRPGFGADALALVPCLRAAAASLCAVCKSSRVTVGLLSDNLPKASLALDEVLGEWSTSQGAIRRGIKMFDV